MHFEAEEVQRRRDAMINGVNEQKSGTLAELQQFANALSRNDSYRHGQLRHNQRQTDRKNGV